MRSKRGERKRDRERQREECGAWSAVGGCERDYTGETVVVRGWLSCRGRAESIKSNVWWRYNEMNLCRAVMPEYLATLFWFCSWPSRHPSRYTVFELNSTAGLSPPLQRSAGRTLPTSRHTLSLSHHLSLSLSLSNSRNISKTACQRQF